MKIGMVCYPTYGGSGVVATELGIALVGRGHEVHFVSYETPVRYTCCLDGLSYHKVEMSSYPLFRYPPYLLAMASKIADVAETEGIELFHVHYAIPHTVSATLARSILRHDEIPIVTTLHGTDITIVGKQPEYYRVVQFALRDSDGLTAVSDSLAQETRDVFKHDGEIEVIPNFVDVNRFRPSLTCEDRDHFAPNGEKLFIHVSNFRPVKNTQDVIRIFAIAAAKMPSRLLMVGDGPDVSACRRLAEELGVKDLVRFLGATPDVARVLACADMFLLPSEHESFGLAALEAMACGIPVIASNTGGIPEVVDEGVTGYMFDPGSTQEMGEAAVALLMNVDKRRAMRKAARARAKELFAPEKIISKYEAYYERILKQKN